MYKKATTQEPWIIVGLVIALLFGAVIVGIVWGIPAFAGRLLGDVKLLVYSVVWTFWDLISEILAPILSTAKEGISFVFAFTGTIAVTSIGVSIFNSAVGHVFRSAVQHFGWRGAIFNRSVWSAAGSVLKQSIKNIGWSTLKSSIGSIIRGATSLVKGFVVALVVELVVSYGLDMISQSLTGQSFAQAIDNAIGGPTKFGTPFGEATWSWGGATKGAIAGAASGAAVGALCGGGVFSWLTAPVGAGIGALVGFITGGLFG